MIVRMRCLVPTFTASGLSMLCSLTAFAQATARTNAQAAAEHAELRLWVIVTFLAFTGVILAGIAGAYALLSASRDRAVKSEIEANRAHVASNAEQITALVKLFEAHDLSPGAHQAASDHNHDPMNEKLDALAAGQHALGVKLERLYAEHKIIRRTELCMMNAANLTARRDPSDSPSPRRATDPEDFDATHPRIRGLEPINDAEEEPDDEA